MPRITLSLAVLAFGLSAAAAQAESALERAADRAQRALSQQRAAPSEIIRVGPASDPRCDYDDLNAAITAAAPGAEIHVTAGTFSGPFFAGDKSLTIIGGYWSCMGDNPESRTTLTGNDTTTVMMILSQDGAAALDLRNLRLKNGSNGAFGGGLEVRGGLTLLLRNILIENNATDEGGGIRVAHSSNTDGALVLMLDGTVIKNNTATYGGGGLSCQGQGGEPHIVVLDNGAITENQAATGGGVYAQHCIFVSLAGGHVNGGGGIAWNTASSKGGGIYARDGASVTINGTAPGFLTPGNPGFPARLRNNTAQSSGAAVYAEGAGTLFQSIDGEIADNTASAGVVVDIRDGAELVIKRGQDTQCDFDSGATSGQCSRIRGNVSPNEIITLMGDGTSGRISQTYISDNRSTSNISAGLIELYGPAGGPGTTLTLEGVTIFDNDTSYVLVESWGDLDFRLEWSTVADN